ncbi:MAG: restriction endonuclease [Bacteroidetes bacterium]|nr:restriction endonuclease [Bacteroidota bacterium]
MTKIRESQEILSALGLPPAQCNELSGLTLLALAQIKEDDSWEYATGRSLTVTKGIMSFVNEHYSKSYAPNTRETFRRQVLHQFVQARIANYNPDIPDLPVNSPRAHYALTPQFLKVVQTYGTLKWENELSIFLDSYVKLSEIYIKERKMNQIPVRLQSGETINLSSGRHNEVQAAIIEKFATRFAPGGLLLYLGDTAKKNLYLDQETLNSLNIPIDQHSKLPDVVIYDKNRNWLFLIEAVTSHGPVSPKRIVEIDDLLKHCSAGKIYVTAFPDMAEFKKHSNNIAWETEVWLMDIPDHLIHFNGDRFLGPRK